MAYKISCKDCGTVTHSEEREPHKIKDDKMFAEEMELDEYISLNDFSNVQIFCLRCGRMVDYNFQTFLGD